jgi:hypothetical protein
VWQGAQAAGLGLAGEVATEALGLLLSGHHPTTGVVLGYPLTDRTLSNGKVDPRGRGVRRDRVGAEGLECVVGVDR